MVTIGHFYFPDLKVHIFIDIDMLNVYTFMYSYMHETMLPSLGISLEYNAQTYQRVVFLTNGGRPPVVVGEPCDALRARIGMAINLSGYPMSVTRHYNCNQGWGAGTA